MSKRFFKDYAPRSIIHLLSLVLIVSTLAVITPQVAMADTAGSGACQQTFTKTGTGQVDVSESGGYCYIAFKNTGAVDSQVTYSWTRPAGINSVDVLVVGGGGSGGARHGGGGGAGGFVQTDAFAISSAATVSIAVGAGGNGSTALYGTNGQSSYFKSSSNGLTALGGGAGANAANAGSGGSGGGAGAGQNAGGVTAQTQTSFSGTTLSGINFGSSGAAGATDSNNPGDNNDYWSGGGGGGAAAAGENPRSNGSLVTAFPTSSSATAVAGKGGDGKSVTWITPAIATALTIGHTSSSTVYFAGGGGGGMGVDGQAGGLGGLGGGATGTRTEVNGNAGTAFTGGGGGGSGFDDINKAGSTATVTAADAGDGGSGVVVIRYSMSACTPSSQTAGGYTILSFTSTTTCSWSVPAGVTAADVLVVGGGGGGAGSGGTGTANSGGGGGGGGAYLANSVPLTPAQTLPITVGSGGTGGITTASRPGTEGSPGGDSAFSTLTAGGGGGGGCATTTSNNVVCTNSSMAGRAGTAGGSGGGATPPWNAFNWGAAGTGSSVTIGGTTFAAQPGYIGAVYSASANSNAGGAGSGGGARTAATTAAVGSGLSSTIAGGSAVEYGKGGRGSNQSGLTFNASTSGYGNGGDGAVVASGAGAAGATGAAGIVIVRYVNAPSITLSSNAISAVIGSLSSYSITQGGGPVTSYSIPSADSTALSAVGVSFSTSTGLISGTPSRTLASRSITITATNANGTTTATFSLVVNNATCAPASQTANGYTTLTFTSTTTCNWTVPTGVTSAEVSVVGGGGGGGFGNNGGGGGAGEVLVSGASATNSSGTITNIAGTSLTPAEVITVSIGVGGTSGAPTGSTDADAITAWNNSAGSTANFGGTGGSTSFGTVVALGGGGGGGNNRINGGTGGSGGGSASGGTAGQTSSNSPSGWTSFKNIGTAETSGNGGGAGGAGVLNTRGGSGVTALGRAVAGGGGGWGRLGGNNSLTDTVLGGNGRLSTGNWPYAGTAPNYTSAGVAGTGTGGGGGAPGGSGVITLRYVSTYTVTYAYNSANGGNATATSTFSPGGSAITLPTPTRTGYVFAGWYTASSGGNLVGAAGANYSPSGTTPGITVQAQWTSSNAALTGLTLSAGTLTPTFATGTYSYTATVPTTVSTGYTVTATKSDSNATVVQYLGATGTTAFTGALSIGENIIRTVVTAQDGSTSLTYTVTVTRESAAALTPTFGSATPTSDGYTVQISNYSGSYTWAGTATASGTVTISGTGLVTVTGVAPGTSSTATITTTRTGYTSGSATVSGTSVTGSALTPTFGTPTATSDGYTVQISNYSGSYTWAGTATASGTVTISGTGLVTVTGVAPGTSSTATITTTRTGYTSGSATVTRASITGAALTPSFSTSTVNANGYTVQISNYSGSYTWAGTATASGAVTISGTGLVTVSGTGPGKLSVATITTTRTGYTSGSATFSATSLSIPATATFGAATDLTLVVIRSVYLQTNPIAARVNTPGKVTFVANNKAIPGCSTMKTVGSGLVNTATCQYRPTSLGTLNITATITPTNTGYLPVTRSIKVIVSPK